MTVRTWAIEHDPNVVVTTTVETQVATSPPVSTRDGGEQVQLSGTINLLPGTAATQATVNVHRGAGLTAVLVSAGDPVQCVAGQPIDIAVEAYDNPGEVAGLVYTVAVQMTSATGNSTVESSDLSITVGS